MLEGLSLLCRLKVQHNTELRQDVSSSTWEQKTCLHCCLLWPMNVLIYSKLFYLNYCSVLKKKDHTKGIGQCIILYWIIEIFDFVNKSINASNTDLQLVVVLLCVLFCSYHILFISSSLASSSGIAKLILISIKRTLLVFHWSDKQLILHLCYCIRLDYTKVHTY